MQGKRLKIAIPPFNRMVHHDVERQHCNNHGFDVCADSAYQIGTPVDYIEFTESSAQLNRSHLNHVDILNIIPGIISGVRKSSYSDKNLYDIDNATGRGSVSGLSKMWLRPREQH